MPIESFVQAVSQWAALLYRVLVVGLVRQPRRRLAHVQLAGHHVGDEPGAVLLEQFDLASGAERWRRTMIGSGLPPAMLDDSGLFGEGWAYKFRQVPAARLCLQSPLKCG